MNYFIAAVGILGIILGCGVITSGAGEPNETVGIVMFFVGGIMLVAGAIRANRKRPE